MKKSILTIIMSLTVVWGAGPSVQAGIIGPELNAVLQSLGPDEEVAVIVRLADQADLKKIKDKYKEKDKLRTEIIKALKDKSDKTQKDLKNFLKQKNAKKVVSYWIFNGMAATVKAGDIAELAGRSEVEKISLDGKIKAPQPTPAASATAEWNLAAIGAPGLWDMGYAGAGAVVASLDTGVDNLHPDLALSYRGGGNSWLDPYGIHATPYDSHGHGTQSMGLIVGGSAGGTAIGVAPDAQWIAVKIFDDNDETSPSAIHQGFQWVLDPDGNPNTNDAADVVNNSWSLANPNNCNTEFEQDIQTLKAAQIAVVFSGGNYGTSGSVSPANNPSGFAVGSIDDQDLIDTSSSSGPSACDGSLYPEVVAPGVGVRTSDLTFGGVFPGSYVDATGTSFAAPHVAGAMALLLSAHPDARVAELELALEGSAFDLGNPGPDNDYGNGLIDVVAAYTLLDQGAGTCTDADGDGFYAEADCGAAQDCNDSDATIYPEATETKHDGHDQDCNGYDLTIDIIKAAYAAQKDTLSVEATSELGKDADLVLEGYGAMSWDRKKAKWKISVRKVGGNPGSVTVSGIEGSETASVN